MPKVPCLRKKFIGFKLGQIGKRIYDEMSREREKTLKEIQKADKGIQDTEALIASFMPNIP